MLLPPQLVYGWEEPPEVIGSVPRVEITAHGNVKQVNDACCALTGLANRWAVQRRAESP